MNKSLNKSDLIKKYIDAGFSLNEASAEVDLAIDILCNLTPKDIILGTMPSEKNMQRLNEVVTRRLRTHEPLAQILGWSYFMGQKFEVSKATLIPRPETELLINKAVEIIKEKDYKQILDIGTGTGCIACMIAKKTNAQVLGIDISNEALKIALNNAMHLDLMNKALFRKSDLFSKIRPEEKYDMIVSNPPYIPPQDKENLQTEVKDFEPETALFTTDEQGLEFYEKITESASAYLNNGGYLLFESGHNQACKIKAIMEKNNFINIEILEDVSGVSRVVIGNLAY